MYNIDISASRSYATKENLIKATWVLDEQLADKGVRKLTVMNEAGRWTAIYFFTDTSYALLAANRGFVAVG
jgi:hypothetical protein